jgi:hypothetical protein
LTTWSTSSARKPGPEAGTPEHAEAAVRLAVIAGRLELDRGATLRISNVPDSGLFEREATVDPAYHEAPRRAAQTIGPRSADAQDAV